MKKDWASPTCVWKTVWSICLWKYFSMIYKAASLIFDSSKTSKTKGMFVLFLELADLWLHIMWRVILMYVSFVWPLLTDFLACMQHHLKANLSTNVLLLGLSGLHQWSYDEWMFQDAYFPILHCTLNFWPPFLENDPEIHEDDELYQGICS